MSNRREQGSTSYPMLVFLVDDTDHITGKTGLTPTVTISKNGAAFGSPSGAVSEVGNGWYALAGNATDRDTLGEFAIHATGTNADPTDRTYEIVDYDPFTAPATGGDATAANQTTILNRLGAITGSGNNTILGFFKAVLSKAAATPSDIGGTFSATTDSTEALQEAIEAIDNYIDTEVAAILAAVDTEIAAIKAKTDLITGAGGTTDVNVISVMGQTYTIGTILSDAGNTATTFKTDLTFSAVEGIIRFKDGSLNKQMRFCTAHNTGTGFVTVNAGFTGTPSPGNTFVVINQ